MDLNTHLGHQLVFLRVFSESTRFGNVVGQWFLAISVASPFALRTFPCTACIWSKSTAFTQSNSSPSFSSISAPIAIYFCRFETLLSLPTAIRIDFRYGGNQRVLVGTDIAKIGTCHSSSSEACVPDGFAGRGFGPWRPGYEGGTRDLLRFD